MRFIALACVLRLCIAPGIPARGFTADIDEFNAIDRADRNAQLTTCAMRGNDGVHALVGAQNGVSRAGFDTEGAAYAPVFVHNGNGQWRFNAVLGAQGQLRSACDAGQTTNALLAARRALIDGGFPAGNGPGICRAVGVTAARALGLGQCCINVRSQCLKRGGGGQ